MTLLFGWSDPRYRDADARRLAAELAARQSPGGRLEFVQREHCLLAADAPGPTGTGTPGALAVGPAAGELPAAAGDGIAAQLAGVAGQFAWAATDGHSLNVAVDRFGSIPLYVARAGAALIFSSELQLLRAHPALRGRPGNLQALYDYLFFSVVPGHLCAWQGIDKLPPANCLHLADGKVLRQRYWLPTYERAAGGEAELERAAVSALDAAVARAASLPEPGCFLSGGLDSSSVCALAARHRGPGVRAFTIGFDEADYDESQYAAITARAFGLDWHQSAITAADIHAQIDRVVDAYGEPFGNASALSALICADLAARSGVRNLLAGDGGDELFAGNERYQKQAVFEVYGHVPPLLRRWLLDPFAPATGTKPRGALAKLGSYVQQARVPLPDRLFSYNLLARNPPEQVLTPEFLARVDIDSPYRYARDVYQAPAAADSLDRMLYLDWALTLADNDLRKVRRTCELAGLDVHFPMLDAAVVDVSTRVPSRQKLGPLRLRRFYKRAFRDVLPAEILRKPKHGFGVPVGRWFEKSPALADRLNAALRGLRQRGIVRPAFIDELLRLQRTEHAVYYGALNWSLFMLEEWLAHHRPSL